MDQFFHTFFGTKNGIPEKFCNGFTDKPMTWVHFLQSISQTIILAVPMEILL